MITSIARAIGPAAFQSLFALTVQKHLLGGYLVYILQLALVGIAVAASFLLKEGADKKTIESRQPLEMTEKA